MVKVGSFEFSTFEIGYIAWCFGFGIYMIVTNWPIFIDDKVGFETTGDILVFFVGTLLLIMGGAMFLGNVIATIGRERKRYDYGYMGR